jgi:hypothetical protein
MESSSSKYKSFKSNNVPYTWKKILKLHDAKGFIRFKVGDGHQIFLWYDNWHPAGCLLDKYRFRAIYDARSYAGAKLSSIIRDRDWFWPCARFGSLVELQSRLPEVDIGIEDLPIWNSRNGVYSCSETWELLREKQPVVDWWKVVWFSLAIPRHSFLLWLVIRDALITKEKMCKWGYAGDSLCLFCRGRQESRNYLFFQCSFSSRVWRELMTSCLIFIPYEVWEEVVKWSVENLHGKSLKTSLCKLIIGAAVYHLWKQRNDLLQGNIPRTEEDLVAQIKWEIRSRIMAKGIFKRSAENLVLIHVWNLHKKILV